jgi:hypothetical protein
MGALISLVEEAAVNQNLAVAKEDITTTVEAGIIAVANQIHAATTASATASAMALVVNGPG